MNSDNEIDILDMNIGGIIMRDMTAITFLQFLAKKLNDVKAYSPEIVALTHLVRNPPMSRLMPNDEKIRIIRLLKKNGITI